MRTLTVLVLCAALGACKTTTPEPPPRVASSRPVPAPTVVDDAARVVAIGDVHGDLDAARAALRLAGVIDDEDRWIGGESVVVQTGDQLDRGDDERAILELFEQLADEAWAAGGAFHSLLGNHETMNVELDLRYVTEGGFADFADVAWEPGDAEIEAYAEPERGRVAAFRPGGRYARMLSGHNVMMVVGETAYVHGGILPDHVTRGLERMNEDVHRWMRGDREPPEASIGGEGPVWVRDYSDEPGPEECARLEEALAAIPASRMVVGHTVQSAITSACDDQVWMVDVGMAAYYGGPIQALEIVDDAARVLEE